MSVFAPFIVAGRAAWVDTWGAPRYGPGPAVRPHEGQDVFCDYGAPVLASEAGTIEFDVGLLGGRVARLYRADGSYWYYAHLADWNTAVLTSGDPVEPGDVIGYCGDSGNAAGGWPHVHFGWYLPGGKALDPMEALVGWLRAAEVKALGLEEMAASHARPGEAASADLVALAFRGLPREWSDYALGFDRVAIPERRTRSALPIPLTAALLGTLLVAGAWGRSRRGGRIDPVLRTLGPLIRIAEPSEAQGETSSTLSIEYAVMDSGWGVASTFATVDRAPVVKGQTLDLFSLGPGRHVVAVTAADGSGYIGAASKTFVVSATSDVLLAALDRAWTLGSIIDPWVFSGLREELTAAKRAHHRGLHRLERRFLRSFADYALSQAESVIGVGEFIAYANGVIASGC